MVPEESPSREVRPHYGTIGCVLAFAGLFAGGMIAVGVGKLVGRLQRCAPAEGLPACDYEVYLLVGMLVGALTLPGMTLWKLRRNSNSTTNSVRS